MGEDDEDQMVVVGAASDEGPESPRVEPLRFEARQVRPAHFEYKSDEEDKEDEKEEPFSQLISESVPYQEVELESETVPELADKFQTEEVAISQIVPTRSLKRIAVRHDDEVASKRQVCFSSSNSYFLPRHVSRGFSGSYNLLGLISTIIFHRKNQDALFGPLVSLTMFVSLLIV